jgi:hypothetical protein
LTDNEVCAWLESGLSPAAIASWPRTKDGHLSIEHSVLMRAADVSHARLIFAIRQNQTLLQNFGESWLRYVSPVTGGIHGNFRIASAGPGRFAASAPNLQQLPIRRSGDRVPPLTVEALGNSEQTICEQLPPYWALLARGQLRWTTVGILSGICAGTCSFMIHVLLPKAIIDQGAAVAFSFGLSSLV